MSQTMVLVLEDGRAHYDIAKESEEPSFDGFRDINIEINFNYPSADLSEMSFNAGRWQICRSISQVQGFEGITHLKK